MNDHFTKKLSALKHEHLSEAERSALRARVVAMTAMAATPVVSPFRFYKHRRSVAVVGVASLFLLSAGASFAAETALPGDTLYTVKVHVNEGVQRALARTPEAKVVVAKKEVERRAVEVEALVKEDRLDEVTKEQLTGDTTDALRSFADAQASLVKAGKVKEAKDSERDLNATISRHRAALSTLGVSDDQERHTEARRGKREELRAVASTTREDGRSTRANERIKFRFERSTTTTTATSSSGEERDGRRDQLATSTPILFHEREEIEDRIEIKVEGRALIPLEDQDARERDEE